MRTLDLTPLYRATVGFDQIADLMDRALASDASNTSYPPYNIEKAGDDAWRISIAVAGFNENELAMRSKIGGFMSPPARPTTIQSEPTCTAALRPAHLNDGSNWPTTCA